MYASFYILYVTLHVTTAFDLIAARHFCHISRQIQFLKAIKPPSLPLSAITMYHALLLDCTLIKSLFLDRISHQNKNLILLQVLKMFPS